MCSRWCRERIAVGREHSPEEHQCWSGLRNTVLDLGQGPTGMKTRLWRTEVQCAQWIVLLFNIIPIVQLTNVFQEKKTSFTVVKMT